MKLKLQINAPKKGVYLLFRDAMLEYIGSSNDIEFRITTHRRDGKIEFDAAFWFECENYLDRERELIRELNPPSNKVHTAKHREKLRRQLQGLRQVAND